MCSPSSVQLRRERTQEAIHRVVLTVGVQCTQSWVGGQGENESLKCVLRSEAIPGGMTEPG